MKYILGTLGVIVLLIVAVVLLANNDGGGSGQQGEPKLELTDFVEEDAVFSWTEQGKVTGNEAYKAMRVTVSRSERRAELLSGYDESVEKSVSHANTQSAYDTFLRALNNAGFSRERESEQKDSRGVCPLGRRFIYSLREGGDTKLYLWSTTCRGDERGTFGGDNGVIRELFKAQIPEYKEFVKGIKL